VRRLVPALSIALVALAATAALPARPTAAGDCAPRVEPAAEKAFGQFLVAFRAKDAGGLVALMAPGDAARLTLRLQGVKSGAYPADQATEVLRRSYFASLEILSVVEGEGCTRGTETRLVRSYRLRVRVQGAEQERTLTAVIVRANGAWSLDAVSDS
jgi:hypothetical protein